MKKYREYMDNVKAPDTLHQKLVELEAPAKPPIPWKRYGAMAAALALVVGLGTWWLSREEVYEPLVDYGPVAPEIADEPVPDIALVEPGDVTEPGQKTLGGYEVVSGSGPDTVVSYYMLPYIAYGPPSDISAAASLAEPAGGLREANREDVLALVGGEDALTAHLNWGGRELRGTVGFEADGTVWMLSLWGEGQDTAFSLELSPGRLPPTCCVVVGEQRTITNVWGVEVSGVNCRGAAYGDTERGIYMDVCREVEFIANGVGCRMKAYGTQDGAVEELVSRFVRWAVLEGLDLSAIGVTQTDGSYICHDCGQTVPAGTKHSHPHIGAGEDGGVSTEPYDPNKAYDVPPVSVSDNPGNGICGYPLAPGGKTGDGVPDMSEPPTLRVRCSEGLVDGRSGNYHWSYPGEDGLTAGAIACGFHPLDSHLDYTSLTTADGTVTLDFSGLPDWVSVKCWPDSELGNTSAAGQTAAAVRGDQTYELTLKDGGWIYELTAGWDDYGTASYVFYLIKN